MNCLLVGRHCFNTVRILAGRNYGYIRSSSFVGCSSARVLRRPTMRHIRYDSSNHFYLSLPIVPSTCNFSKLLRSTFHSHGWKSGGGSSSNYWWTWWEKLVKSVNRRCLLCAGAIFLWDRERITNQELSKSLSKYEKRVSQKISTKPTSFVAGSTNEPANGAESIGDDSSIASEGSTSGVPSKLSEKKEQVSSHSETPNESKEQSKQQCEDDPENVQPKKRKGGQYSKRSSSSERMKNRASRLKKSTKASDKSRQKDLSGEKEQERQNGHEEGNKNHESEKETDKEKVVCEEFTKGSLDHDVDPMKGWEPISTQGNCTIYSKPYKDTNLCQYKVIGYYPDITARDFLDVQIEDRMSWDSYCLSLKTIDRDSSTGTEVIHWIAKFPFPMTDRDYVFVRRHWISPDDKAIVIINRAVEHPQVPAVRKYIRVKSYFSEMVIKPTTFIDEPGFHFELTYFDDPGSYIPSSAVTWVTNKATPEYLNKIYKAALQKQLSSSNHHHKHLA